MERIICLAAGYVCGLFQTGYLYGKLHHIDIRQHGSGNAGTTNALRVMGWKAGLTVFFGDFLKTLLPCAAVRILMKDAPDMKYLLLLYTGLGVILGHNFPFYLHFRGGKGIAAMAGLIVAVDWRLTLICLTAFVLVVAVTRFVSLGSLVVASVFFVWMAACGMHGPQGNYMVGTAYVTEYYVMAGLISGMAFWRHRANIGRLIKGTENKFGVKKE